MIRSSCALCASKSLTPIHTLKAYPLSFGSHEGTDEFGDLHFIGCEACGCVQLQTLVDPETLYKNAHNNTYNTPTWRDHHDQFKTFILTDLSGSSLLEFGGSSGALAKRIVEERSGLEYTIVDLCSEDPAISGVAFQSGNCESYPCLGATAVAMSHVFEHLYKPLDFIKNMNNNNVNSIYISIPNMDLLLDRRNISFLHIEHTFFINKSYLYSMFQQYGYQCVRSMEFRDHSIFFHFQRGAGPVTPYQNLGFIDKFRAYFIDREHSIQSIPIERPIFIAPAGHFGQLIYYYLKHNTTRILGCLDNDPTKLNKRMYGAPCKIYRMDHISKYTEPVTILLADSPYVFEIRDQLLSYNPECHIHIIRLTT